ncbi:flagellin [Paenibacillus sp. J5C2022]|uniref:flagellin N-terminal helical domain-containing protein n=1 Tax=Paenibacillus sp. J5C2022 TaxID=2977129 RepID=UPI00293F3BDE|nr:flagellin [Paenibacillus sp. J5C2022]
MRINHNIAALNTNRQLAANGFNSSKNLEKLSSGLRINRAGDDAAGLAISEKMRGQIRGLEQATRNAQDGISLIQTAEGALNETHSILQRMRELATQSANDTNTTKDREAIQEEMNQLSSEINRIANTTEFNTRKILNGDISVNGVMKQLDGSETVSANLANLKVDDNAATANGDYKIEITNQGGQTVQNVGDNVLAGTGVNGVSEYSGADEDLDLAEGNYKVVVQSTSAKSTSSVADDAVNGVLNSTGGNNPVTIDANSVLANGTGYEVEVTKTTAINATAVSGGGISNVNADNGTDASEGTYVITSSAAVTAGDGAGAADKDLMDNGVISNVTIESNSAYNNATGYKIAVTQTDGDETDGSISFTFELQDSTGTAIAGATATTTVTSSSGSTQIKIGDVTFDADLSQLWASDTSGDATAGSLDAGEVELTIGNKISVTQSATGDTQEVVVADGAASATQSFTFSDGGELKLDVADDAGQFTRGNTYTTTVSYDDTYSIQMRETDGTTARGAAVTLTESDLTDPNNLTNIQVGDAGDGVQIDLDLAKLNALTSGTTATTTFDVGTSTAFTAQLQQADGSAVAGAGSYALTGTGATEKIDLGFNVSLDYDGTTLAAGDTFFSVKDVTTADDYRMSLLRDSDGNGSFETTDVNEQAFALGDTVTLGSSGVSIDTTTSTTTADNATFTVENGVTDNSLSMQIGANSGQTLSIEIADMRSQALKVTGDTASSTITASDGKEAILTSTKTVTNGSSSMEYSLDISSADKASAAISVLDDAINSVSTVRSKLGAYQNRLEHTINNLGTSAENLTAAESRIRDVDMAKEMMEFTKNNILSQAAQAMLAQANQRPQGVLQLLG